MKPKEFISALSKRLNKSQDETAQLVEYLVTDMTKELQDDKCVSFQEFGSFEVRKKAERISVNPTTQQRLLVPPKYVLAFRPHNKLKDKFK